MPGPFSPHFPSIIPHFLGFFLQFPVFFPLISVVFSPKSRCFLPNSQVFFPNSHFPAELLSLRQRPAGIPGVFSPFPIHSRPFPGVFFPQFPVFFSSNLGVFSPVPRFFSLIPSFHPDFPVELLSLRQRRAEALRELTEAAPGMSEEQLQELRNDIKVSPGSSREFCPDPKGNSSLNPSGIPAPDPVGIPALIALGILTLSPWKFHGIPALILLKFHGNSAP